jgi:hypothetical protein
VSMLWLGGPRMNLLATGTSVTPSVSADALFPTSGLYDGKPGVIFRFGSRTSAPNVTANLELTGGTGLFESWSGGSPVGWTEANSGTGAVTEEAVIVAEGTRAAKFSAGTGTATLYKDLTLRPGQKLNISSQLYQGSIGGMILRIRNQDTGNYCSSAGTWLPTSQDFQSPGGTTGAYEAVSTDTVVEDYATIQKATTVVRLQLYNEVAASDSYADNVRVNPGYNFVSIHGHNIDYRSAPVFRTAADNFSGAGTLRGTFTVRQPSMYLNLGSTTIYHQYVRVLFADTNSETSGAIYMGELVVGDTSEFRGPALPLQANYSDQQVRVPHRFGAPAIYGMGRSELRSFPLTIRCESTSDRDDFFNEWRRTIGGYPVVVVPHDGDGHTDVVFGQVEEALPHSWATKKFATLSTTLDELPLPLLIG